MVKMSGFVVGFILALAASVVLLSFVTDFTLSYGITNAQLMNQTGGQCGARETITAIQSINALFQNTTVDGGTYAPGQINAPVGDSITTATQSAGLITMLKVVVAPLTLGKAVIGDMACSVGIPSQLILALEIAFAISVLFLIAGIFYFRSP